MAKQRTPEVNYGHPLAKGILVDIPIFEGGGAPKDVGAIHQKGTVSSTPTWSRDIFGYKLTFDTNDRIDYASFLPWQARKVSSWQVILKVDTFPGAGQSNLGNIWSDESNTGTGASCIYRLGSQGSAALNKRIGVNFQDGSDHDTENSTDLVANTLYNIIVTTDGTNIKWYINGKLDTTKSYTITPRTGQYKYMIGNDGSGVRVCSGSVYLNRKWENRALRASDVLQLYVNPWQVYKNPIKPPVNTGIH
jgi:hypothetical protein